MGTHCRLHCIRCERSQINGKDENGVASVKFIRSSEKTFRIFSANFIPTGSAAVGFRDNNQNYYLSHERDGLGEARLNDHS